jgi:hypothetical protein
LAGTGCVECLSPTDCELPDDPCLVATCDSNSCGTTGGNDGATCDPNMVCSGGSCICEFEECDSGCCAEGQVCLDQPSGGTACGDPQPLGETCSAAEQCESENCARVQNISSGNVPVCCSPIGGPCTGGGTSTQCCDDGIDGTNTSGNAASCSNGTCCVTNNFACTDVSQCCQGPNNGACQATDGVQRCCLVAGHCGGGIRCCDGYSCVSDQCVQDGV